MAHGLIIAWRGIEIKKPEIELVLMQLLRNFEASLLKELSEFKSRGGIFYDDRVAHLSTIHAACIEFLPNLNQSNQERFANLWQEYNKYEKLRAISLLEMPDEKTEYYLTQLLSFTE